MSSSSSSSSSSSCESSSSYEMLMSEKSPPSNELPSPSSSETQNQFLFIRIVCLFGAFNIWGHITTVPTLYSGSLTNVLPYRNAIPQTQDMTSHPFTVNRHGADLLLCYSLMWNVTLEDTTTLFNVLGQTWSGNPSPTIQTHQWTLNFMMLMWWYWGRSSVESVPYPTGLEPGTCGVWIHYAIHSPTAASFVY